MNPFKSLVKFHTVLLVVLMAFATPHFVTGCAGPQSAKTVAGKSLETVAVSVHSAMNTYGVLFRAGKITPETRVKILSQYKLYQDSMSLALITLNYDTSQPSNAQVSALADGLIAIITSQNH